jgi:hypothetical protein
MTLDWALIIYQKFDLFSMNMPAYLSHKISYIFRLICSHNHTDHKIKKEIIALTWV